jgi:hypothetical protein
VCSKGQPDDDPIGSKHAAVRIFYEVVFDGNLLTSYLKTTVHAPEASGVNNLQRILDDSNGTWNFPASQAITVHTCKCCCTAHFDPIF